MKRAAEQVALSAWRLVPIEMVVVILRLWRWRQWFTRDLLYSFVAGVMLLRTMVDELIVC